MFDREATKLLLQERAQSGPTTRRALPHRAQPQSPGQNQPAINPEAAKTKADALSAQIHDLEAVTPTDAIKQLLESLRSQLQELQPKEPPTPPKPKGKELDHVDHKIRVQTDRINKSQKEIQWHKEQLADVEAGLQTQQEALAQLRKEKRHRD